jgi:hypothetical protein
METAGHEANILAEPRPGPSRHRKLVRWFIGIVGGTLVGLWIALAAVSRAPVLQQRLIEALDEHMDADVQLEGFTVDSFPTLKIHGDNLKLRLKGQQQAAPFIEIRHFEVSGGLFGLLRRQKRFRTVELEGLRITIPPRTRDDKEAGKRAATTVEGPVLIDHVVAKDAQLVLVAKDPRKEPKVWSIHNLDLEDVGFDRAMPFEATLTNPIPKGEIATTGKFGPWVKGDPGLTPLGGKYAFNKADLNTIKGIAGTLTSTGEFSGELQEIEVKGKTSTPNFSLDIGGTAMPLETTFHAVVDGTNGNTYLKDVKATLGETHIETSGAIESRPGIKGRFIALDMAIRSGRIQDVLHLAMKGSKPPMLGLIALQAKMLLPPGEGKVWDRLDLAGRFVLENAAFTDPQVQEQIAMLSRRAQGKKPTDDVGKIQSDMRGSFKLHDGVMTLNPFGFSVPGADVQISGTYGLRSEQLAFKGDLLMAASVSQAAGGIKGFFLKPFDPLFRDEKTKGSRIPIVISGPREKPKFGLEWGKVFK